MSIQLKLDTNAVESLFPEGSEVRVQLQNAVIAEMTKRLYDKAMKEALNEALSGLRAVIDEKAKEVRITRHNLVNKKLDSTKA